MSGSDVSQTSRPFLRMREVNSSVFFQASMYYNTMFSVAFGIVFLPLYRWKYMNYDMVTVTISPIVYGGWVISEVCRLLLGYYGNLQERVPHFAAFLFISIFPQLPINIYMAYLSSPVTPWDQIAGTILILFELTQIISGVGTIRRIIKYQTARFMLDVPDQSSRATPETTIDPTRLFQRTSSVELTTLPRTPSKRE